MRECVSIHLGQNGCGVGRAMWKLLCHEHDIGPDGVSLKPEPSATSKAPNNSTEDPLVSEANLEPFFFEKDWQYTPRAIFFDPDPAGAFAFDDSTAYNRLFQPRNLVFGGQDSTQNLMPLAMDGFRSRWNASPPNGFKFLLRKELERCDHPSTFVVSNSVCGGTGSGVGAYLLYQLRDIAPAMSIVNLCHLPAPQNNLSTNSMLGVFNACLSLPEIADTSNMSLVFDNEALFDAALNHLEIPEASFTLLNDLVASLYGSLTCPVRFPYSKRVRGLSGSEAGGLTYSTLDLAAICETLVPIQRLPFVVGGFAPITSVRENISLEKEVPSYSLKLTPKSNTVNMANTGLTTRTSKLDTHMADTHMTDTELMAHTGLTSEPWLDRDTRQRLLEARDQRECDRMTTHKPAAVSRARRKPCVRELCWALFHPDNMLSAVDPYKGRFLKSLVLFRGVDVTRDEVIRQTIAIEHHGVQDMLDMWLLRMPRRVHCHTFKVPERQLMMSAAFFGLLTTMADRFSELDYMYTELLRRNAFVHRYMEAGLEKADLEGAHERMVEMSKQYQGLEQLLALRQLAEMKETGDAASSSHVTDASRSSPIVRSYEERKEEAAMVEREEEAFLMRTKIKFIWP